MLDAASQRNMLRQMEAMIPAVDQVVDAVMRLAEGGRVA